MGKGATALRIQVLGPLSITDGHEVRVLRPSRPTTLLAVLLLHANSVVSVGCLLRAVWGADQPTTAKAALQTCVLRLRRLLAEHGVPGTPVEAVPGGYRMDACPGTLDLLGFRERLRVAEGLASDGGPEAELHALKDALTLWQGSLLVNVPSPELHRDEVPRLVEERLRALERVCALELALGRCADALVELSRVTRLHPGHERFRQQLIEALYRSGRQSEALAEYGAIKRHLRDELGVDPSPALQRLERAMLRGEDLGGAPSARLPAIRLGDPPSIPRADASLTPLAPVPPEVRTGGGPVPCVPAETWPVAERAEATADGQAAGAVSDVTDVPSFAGRAAEVATLTEWLRPGRPTGRARPDGSTYGPACGCGPEYACGHGCGQGCGCAGGHGTAYGAGSACGGATAAYGGRTERHDGSAYGDRPGGDAGHEPGHGGGGDARVPQPVLLCGAPGTGKTALVLHVAHLLRAGFPGGALLVRMVRPDGTPRGPGELARELAAVRAGRGGGRALLVFDDVVDAEQIRPLLPTGPVADAVLVTSRRQLAGLVVTHGGRVHRLGPLGPSAARQLLRAVLGAGRVEAEPEAAARIAELCGGHPLALRIAAARLQTRPGLALPDAADWLARDPLRRLAVADDPALSVRRVFGRALDRLDPRMSEAFLRATGMRRFGPLGTFRAEDAAGRLGMTVAETEQVLDQLVDAGLLEDGPPAPYRVHPLLHAYARAAVADARTGQREGVN